MENPRIVGKSYEKSRHILGSGLKGPFQLQSTVSESDSHKGLEKIDSCTLRTRSEPLWGVVRIPTVNRFPQDYFYAPFNRKTTRGLELKTNILAFPFYIIY